MIINLDSENMVRKMHLRYAKRERIDSKRERIDSKRERIDSASPVNTWPVEPPKVK